MRLFILFVWLLVNASAVFAQSAAPSNFFVTSDRCIACHSGLATSSGEDVSIGYSWRASMMANAARDPYWHAAVRREVMDHPAAQAEIENECSTCHMPMTHYEAASSSARARVFAYLDPRVTDDSSPFAMDGVSCTVCHQILDDNFGQPESFTGGFALDRTTPLGERRILGPHVVDKGRTTVMQSSSEFTPSEGAHLQESEMCATCHTLYTHALNDAGERIGEFPEQVPYLEWRHSEFRRTQSCQSCHMPELAEDTPISSVLGQPRPAFSQHVFRGGNAFMLGILNKYRAELNVTALPQELDATIRRTKAFLGTQSARVEIESAAVAASRLEFVIVVENLAGHKLPTAYPSRRAWLHVTVSQADGSPIFESGALRLDGSIVGNSSDADGTRFEPHYDRIERADQVQVYEPILGDYDGRVTTGLLYGVSYLKDNRLLPRGFDKATAAEDIAVHGAAFEDRDFAAGGDRIRYSIDVAGVLGPLRVTAELLYQSIGYRWASNLLAYDSHETNRFVGYYQESAQDSAVLLAQDSANVIFD